MKLAQIICSGTTFNTQECTNATDKMGSLVNFNNSDGQNLYNSEQQTDDSFEMEVLYKNHPENEWIKKEHQIVIYLKQLGLKMKTDPIEKQEKFYRKPKRRMNKSSTMSFDRIPNIDSLEREDNKCVSMMQQMSIEMNSIKQRRTPSTTPQSSPLITKQLQNSIAPKEKRMSIFQKMKHQDLSSDEEEIENNILRNQQEQNENNNYSDDSESKSDVEENYFQNL